MEKKEDNETQKLHDVQVQMEYYLSDENLKKDEFFHGKISSNPEGYVELEYFMKCNKIIKNGWKMNDIVEGVKQSPLLELDNSCQKVRRKDNKPLPELTLLKKKRKKDEEDEEEKEEEQKATIDPVILKVTTEADVNIKWKNILEEFKKTNPNLEVIYGRFKGKEGHIAVLLKPEEELEFKDKFTLEGTEFSVSKCQGDDLIDFWKDHGSHYELCIKSNRVVKKKKKTNGKGSVELEEPIKLGDKEFKSLASIKSEMRALLSKHKDNEKFEKEEEKTLLDLLKYHHSYDEKVKDFDYFTTGKPDKFAFSRCFFVVKKDGKKEDFSFQKCIDGIEQKHLKKKDK